MITSVGSVEYFSQVPSGRSQRTVDCHTHTCTRRFYYEAGGFDLFSLTNSFFLDYAAISGEEPSLVYAEGGRDEDRWLRFKAVIDGTFDQSICTETNARG